MRPLVRDVVWRSIGKLPAYELVRKARRPLGTLRAAGREQHEVHRARRSLRGLPTAMVATIIPTYYRPEALLRAVDSARAQTMADQVILVIDDGGGLPELPPDPRVVPIRLERNLGVVGAVRNVGIRSTRSRYLAFLDDDNEWYPDHLERSLAAHANGAALTYTEVTRVLPDGTVHDVLAQPFSRALLRERSFIDTSAIVVDRGPGTRFSRVPREENAFPGEDWEFAYRMSRSRRTELVPARTVRYLVNPDGRSRLGTDVIHPEGRGSV